VTTRMWHRGSIVKQRADEMMLEINYISLSLLHCMLFCSHQMIHISGDEKIILNGGLLATGLPPLSSTEFNKY
jgi:hypothetical protein